MQVTNVQDHVTHAVIGGTKTQEFTIAQTAEFFQILSSSLYSNKKLAVVRETLCNAWDSHIESGITQIPIEVKLDKERLSIRDFGEGIAPALMATRYCTYGGSTKVANENVTGGFGLGCKAPFAYVDHFDVISQHLGEKTIYKLSLSSAMVGGKPSLQTIVSVPTDDSGLEVALRLKDPSDRDDFESLIRQIASLGGMNVKLNGLELPKLPFDQADEGFTLVKVGILPMGTAHHKINIRYGHVVYPIDLHKEYHHEYHQALNFLNMFEGTRFEQNYNLILQAAPNTVSVTPSRESLSMTEATTATVKQLLINFVSKARDELEKSCVEELKEGINSVWLTKTPRAIFDPSEAMPHNYKMDGYWRYNVETPETIIDFKSAAKTYTVRTYPDFRGFRQLDMRLRINALIETGFGGLRRRGLIQSFRRSTLDRDKMTTKAAHRWWLERLLNPLVQDIEADPEMRTDNLRAYIRVPSGRRNGRWCQERDQFLQVNKYLPRLGEFHEYFQFLRGIVILAHAADEAVWLGEQKPVMNFWLGKARNSLLYRVPRNPKKIAHAKAFFEARGFTVVDVTSSQAEPKERSANAGLPPKPKKVGLPCLDQGKDFFDREAIWDEEAKRIEDFEFVVQVSTGNGSYPFANTWYNEDFAHIVTRLFGSKCGVTRNSIQYDKHVQAGAKSLTDYVFPLIRDEFKTNKAIEQWMRQQLGKEALDYWEAPLFEVVVADDELRKKYGLVDPPDQRAKDFINMWSGFRSREVEDSPVLTEVSQLIKSWTISPEAEAVVDKLRDNELAQLLQHTTVKHRLTSPHTDAAIKQKTRDILLLVLEG